MILLTSPVICKQRLFHENQIVTISSKLQMLSRWSRPKGALNFKRRVQFSKADCQLPIVAILNCCNFFLISIKAAKLLF